MGGDPLMLPDETLEDILSNLEAIPNVEFIRLGTRMPVYGADEGHRGPCI